MPRARAKPAQAPIPPRPEPPVLARIPDLGLSPEGAARHFAARHFDVPRELDTGGVYGGRWCHDPHRGIVFEGGRFELADGHATYTLDLERLAFDAAVWTVRRLD
jgi:hypothetical protein